MSSFGATHSARLVHDGWWNDHQLRPAHLRVSGHPRATRASQPPPPNRLSEEAWEIRGWRQIRKGEGGDEWMSMVVRAAGLCTQEWLQASE